MRKNWNRHSYAAVVALVAVVLALGAFRLARRQTIRAAAASPITVQPYTITLRVTSFVRHPQGRLLDIETYARRCDGSLAFTERVFSPPGVAPEIQDSRRLDLADGRELTLVDGLRAKVVWPPKTRMALATVHRLLSHPPAHCTLPGQQLLGFKTVGGQKAAEVVTMTLPDGSRVVSLQALGLECASLGYTAEMKQSNGTYRTQSQATLVRLTLGAPSTALFNPGAGYESVMPSQLLRLEVASHGLAWTPRIAKMGSQQDQAFRARAAALARQ